MAKIQFLETVHKEGEAEDPKKYLTVMQITKMAATDERTDGTLLTELTEHRDKEIRVLACQNKSLPKETMVKVARGGEYIKRKARAQNQGLFVALQRKMLKDPAQGVLVALAENEVTSPSVLAVLAHHKSKRVRATVARRKKGLTTELCLEMLNDPEEEVLMGLAANFNGDPEILTRLSTSDNKEIRRMVAGNSNTPGEVLLRMAKKEEDTPILQSLARRIAMPEAGMRILMEEENCWDDLAQNPNLPADLAFRLAHEGDEDIKRRILFNPSTGEELQLWLAIQMKDGQWVGVDSWRSCGSERVTSWLKDRKPDQEKCLIGEGFAERSYGGITLRMEFPKPEETSLTPFKGFTWSSSLVFGWWEPAMGEEWLGLVDSPLAGVGFSGMVPLGVEKMGQYKLGFIYGETGSDYNEKLEGWLFGEWTVETVGDELLAHNWARKIRKLESLPPLPRFQLEYEREGEPTTCGGILLLQDRKFALWLNEDQKEMGWEEVSGYAEVMTPHRVVWTEEGYGPAFEEVEEGGSFIAEFQWERFEELLRQAAFGRAI